MSRDTPQKKQQQSHYQDAGKFPRQLCQVLIDAKTDDTIKRCINWSPLDNIHIMRPDLYWERIRNKLFSTAKNFKSLINLFVYWGFDCTLMRDGEFVARHPHFTHSRPIKWDWFAVKKRGCDVLRRKGRRDQWSISKEAYQLIVKKCDTNRLDMDEYDYANEDDEEEVDEDDNVNHKAHRTQQSRKTNIGSGGDNGRGGDDDDDQDGPPPPTPPTSRTTNSSASKWPSQQQQPTKTVAAKRPSQQQQQQQQQPAKTVAAKRPSQQQQQQQQPAKTVAAKRPSQPTKTIATKRLPNPPSSYESDDDDPMMNLYGLFDMNGNDVDEPEEIKTRLSISPPPPQTSPRRQRASIRINNKHTESLPSKSDMEMDDAFTFGDSIKINTNRDKRKRNIDDDGGDKRQSKLYKLDINNADGSDDNVGKRRKAGKAKRERIRDEAPSVAVVIDLDDEDEENKQDEDWVDKRDDKRRDQQSSSSPSPPPPPPASTHRLRKRNKLRLPKQFNRLDVIYDDIDALLSTRVVASPPPTPSTNWPKGISTSSDESSSSDDSESDRSRDSDDDEDDSDEEDLAAMIDDSEVYSD